jgi:hypothetical protein
VKMTRRVPRLQVVRDVNSVGIELRTSLQR